MNKVEFVDAVIELHNIARLVETEIGNGTLAENIRKCADQLHVLALDVRIAQVETNNLINKAKE